MEAFKILRKKFAPHTNIDQKPKGADKQKGADNQKGADKQKGADNQKGADKQKGADNQKGADKQKGADNQKADQSCKIDRKFVNAKEPKNIPVPDTQTHADGRKNAIQVTDEREISNRKSSISEEKLQELHETFVLFDKNRDGMITKEELGSVLYALGQRPTTTDVQALIRSVDLDSSGTIDFDEFVKIFSAKLTIDPETELHEVFTIFDQNGDGFISTEELFNMLQNLGENITMTEAQKMINEADLNRDGKVDYREFKTILNAR